MKRSTKQAAFEFPSRGGARSGAGRKRVAPRPSVPHRARPKLSGRHPLHVTVRVVDGVQSLRSSGVHATLRDALRDGAERFGLRVVHYGAAANHVHLVCEAENGQALAHGMKGLLVRIARGVNRFLRRTGALFADRYHARELTAPRDVRNVLVYVFGNARKHGAILTEALDACSSAACFEGWSEMRARPTWLARARTWLLTTGWRRRGLISIRELPLERGIAMPTKLLSGAGEALRTRPPRDESRAIGAPDAPDRMRWSARGGTRCFARPAPARGPTHHGVSDAGRSQPDDDLVHGALYPGRVNLKLQCRRARQPHNSTPPMRALFSSEVNSERPPEASSQFTNHTTGAPSAWTHHARGGQSGSPELESRPLRRIMASVNRQIQNSTKCAAETSAHVRSMLAGSFTASGSLVDIVNPSAMPASRRA